MDVLVDPELCEANARCVTLVPEVFSLDDDEVLQIAPPGDGIDPDRVRRAVNSCPLAALSLTETPPPIPDS